MILKSAIQHNEYAYFMFYKYILIIQFMQYNLLNYDYKFYLIRSLNTFFHFAKGLSNTKV